IVDSLPYGALVTDRNGKIVYANARYSELSSAVGKGEPVGVARLFASSPEASEAMYRLARAAREGRAVVEDIRLTRGGGPVSWYRVGVRALPQIGRDRLVVWSVEDITRDRESQENFYVELQK